MPDSTLKRRPQPPHGADWCRWLCRRGMQLAFKAFGLRNVGRGFRGVLPAALGFYGFRVKLLGERFSNLRGWVGILASGPAFRTRVVGDCQGLRFRGTLERDFRVQVDVVLITSIEGSCLGIGSASIMAC